MIDEQKQHTHRCREEVDGRSRWGWEVNRRGKHSQKAQLPGIKQMSPRNECIARLL